MELVIEKSPLQAWLRHLSAILGRGLGKSGARSAAALDGMDVFALLEAAIRQDFARLQALADAAHADTQTLQTFAQLAVMPPLHACHRRLADTRPHAWAHGYCPCCGAWAVLAERRGLERARHLRCGRCGGEWRTDWLRCPFCGETNHERLAFLVPEGKDETQSVATCASCQGYIKTLTTLQGAAPQAVMLDDLTTVALDVVAVERGYARPRQPGYCVNLHLVERTPSWSSFLRRFT
jgi:FdhE protein